MKIKIILLLFVALLFISCGDNSSNDAIENNTTIEDNVTVIVVEPFLFKTGQTESYYGSDDGYYHYGASREYVKVNSTVEEKTKGLIWQDDSAVSEKTFTRDEAYNYCLSLTIDGNSDWRLPTLQEQFALINYSSSSPALDSSFESTVDRYYWSSTICAVCAGLSFATSEKTGIFQRWDNSNEFQARCVSGDTTLEGSYNRDSSAEVVLDSNRKLMWQDGSSLEMQKQRNFEESILYCESLDLSGYTDWRLPSIIELRSIYDFTGTSSALNLNFVEVDGEYWSSTTSAEDTSKAWSADFYKALSNTRNKTNNIYTRCVRAVE